MVPTRLVPFLLGSAAAIFIAPLLVNAQGFTALGGLKKAKEAELKRILPASVNLNQKRIKVSSLAAPSNIPKDLVEILRTKWVTALQKDPRFILDDRNPETELRFTITNYYVEERKVAATQNSPACSYYTGKIEASYQAVEVGTDAPLDSENLSYSINTDGERNSTSEEASKEASKKTSSLLGGFGGLTRSRRSNGETGCGGGKATQYQARDSLIDGLVLEMSRRATPFEEVLEVPVPVGKLEPLSALALNQRWAKLLEDAEKAEPLPKPDDDAYRLYLIGLANEALAYQDAKDAAELEKARHGDVTSPKAKQSMTQEDKDFNEAEAYLDKATKAYKDAMQAKPGEKEFRYPDARMEQAVRLYSTINRHKTEYEEAVAKKKNEHVGAATTQAARADGPAASAGASAYIQVIGMCQDHIPEIGQLIKDHSSELRFEKGLTLNEELRLKKECGAESKGIMEAIKAQNNPAPVAADLKPTPVVTRTQASPGKKQ